MLKPHPDFLTFSYNSPTLASAVGVVENLLGFQDLCTSDFSLDGNLIRSASGLVGFSETTFEGFHSTRLELGGLYFSYCSDWTLPLKFVHHRKLNLTRIDLACDDYQMRITPGEVADIARSGQFRLFETFEIQESAVRDSESGITCYFGRKGSEKLLRYYDSRLVHDINAYRWELQLRRDHSQLALDMICRSQSPAAELMALIFGSVDFGFYNHTVFEQFDWWLSLLKDSQVEPVKCNPDPKDPNLERSVNWVRNQCSPTLGVLLRALGRDRFVNFILQASATRLKPYHYAWIDHIQDNNFFKEFD